MSEVVQFFSARAQFFYGGVVEADDVIVNGVSLAGGGGSTAGTGTLPVLLAQPSALATGGLRLVGNAYNVETTDGGAGGAFTLALPQSLRVGTGTSTSTDTGSLVLGGGTTTGAIAASTVSAAGGAVNGASGSLIVAASSILGGVATDSFVLAPGSQFNGALTDVVALGRGMGGDAGVALNAAYLAGPAIGYGASIPAGTTVLSGGVGAVDASSAYYGGGGTLTRVAGAARGGLHLVGRPNVRIESQAAGTTEFLGRPVCDPVAYPSTLPGHLISKAEMDALVFGAGTPQQDFVLMAADAGAPNGRVLTGTANGINVTDGGAGTTVTVALPNGIAVGPVGGGTYNGSVAFGTGGSLASTANNSLVGGRDVNSLATQNNTMGVGSVNLVGNCTNTLILGREIIVGSSNRAFVVGDRIVPTVPSPSLGDILLLGTRISFNSMNFGSVLISGGEGLIPPSSPYYDVGDADGVFTRFTSVQDNGVHIVGKPNVWISSQAAGETRFEGRPVCDPVAYPSTLPGHLISKSEMDAALPGGGPPATFYGSSFRGAVLAVIDSKYVAGGGGFPWAQDLSVLVNKGGIYSNSGQGISVAPAGQNVPHLVEANLQMLVQNYLEPPIDPRQSFQCLLEFFENLTGLVLSRATNTARIVAGQNIVLSAQTAFVHTFSNTQSVRYRIRLYPGPYLSGGIGFETAPVIESRLAVSVQRLV